MDIVEKAAHDPDRSMLNLWNVQSPNMGSVASGYGSAFVDSNREDKGELLDIPDTKSVGVGHVRLLEPLLNRPMFRLDSESSRFINII